MGNNLNATEGVIPVQLSNQYHIFVNNEQKGPYDASALMDFILQGTLTPETQVWSPAMDQWASASTVPELVQLLNAKVATATVVSSPQMEPPIQLANQYTVLIKNQQMGPYDAVGLMELVKQGTLTGYTRVWSPAMSQWALASTVAELEPILKNKVAIAQGKVASPIVAGLNTDGLIGLILSVIATVGSVFAFTEFSLIIQAIATIVGVIGLVFCRKGMKNGKDKTIAIIGLIINILGLLFSLFVYFIFITGGLAKTGVGIAKEAGAFDF